MHDLHYLCTLSINVRKQLNKKDTMDYNFRDIEQKWQKRWVENGTYRVVEDKNKKKFYVLNMFPLWGRLARGSSPWLYRQ